MVCYFALEIANWFMRTDTERYSGLLFYWNSIAYNTLFHEHVEMILFITQSKVFSENVYVILVSNFLAVFYYFSQPVLLDLDDWLTVHRSITLVDLQLDAQNSYLFIYNTFIKILYMFRALPCSSSGGLRTRGCIYTIYDVDLLKMSRVMLETCRGF